MRGQARRVVEREADADVALAPRMAQPLGAHPFEVPSVPSLTCTMISCSNAEWRRMLSMHSCRYGRLFQVGIRILNIALNAR